MLVDPSPKFHEYVSVSLGSGSLAEPLKLIIEEKTKAKSTAAPLAGKAVADFDALFDRARAECSQPSTSSSAALHIVNEEEEEDEEEQVNDGDNDGDFDYCW